MSAFVPVAPNSHLTLDHYMIADVEMTELGVHHVTGKPYLSTFFSASYNLNYQLRSNLKKFMCYVIAIT